MKGGEYPMPKFKGKEFPLRKGMTITFRNKNGSYQTGKILNDWYTYCRTHLFKVETNKGKFTITGRKLYETAEIRSLGSYTYWQELIDSVATRKN
jgi:hypothetical protein